MATATTQGAITESVRKGPGGDHIFFPAMGVLILVTVIVGFARTYYLAGMVRAHLPSPIIHIHAVVFSLWVLLLVTQTSLVAAHRIDVHRKLGLVGFGLACLVPVIGVLAATNSLSRNFAPPGFPLGAQTFYVIPMSSMLLFTTLAFFAYRERRNPAVHKRLILIATFALMDAPTGRAPLSVITGHPHMESVFSVVFLLLLVAYDLWSTRKVLRVTIWAGIFMVVVQQVRVPIGMTGAWHSFAAWAQHLA